MKSLHELYRITFDEVMLTMRQTGMDLGTAYRETSRGGLAFHSHPQRERVRFPRR